ncbi:hypothetical protein N7510_004988 [Penicillium lagena]|uniref:uncharacterized protein n=1 Tax=Penicillium lagena TaxID=94218 RepID=UPI00253F8225|nr:uncharacterized protein N7510_004988 [Penicillium lagena]KAJ5621004.1 hypothetical protein N7510_004988 [Penicillium lagena]
MVGHQHYDDHFSINNIPFGIGSSVNHPVPQCVTRLERTIIFLGVLQQSGAFSQVPGLPEGIFKKSTLNEYASLSKDIQREVRKLLQSYLTGDLPPNSSEDVENVAMNLPVSIGGFTDFSCSLHHVKNAGRAILNDDAPPPGFFNFPIGYNGRTSTIVVSGTPIIRPHGHFYDRTAPTETKPIIFGPSRAVDYELELGFIVGKSVPQLQGLNAKDADEHIFGMVILNDWSARDIQGCEMVPLGPLNGKSFATTISPWIVTLEALEPFRVPGTEHKVSLASHLEDVTLSSYDIMLKVHILVGDQDNLISQSKITDLYWSGRQMAAHLASSGADLQTGDILGTGTVSGEHHRSLGCLLEATKAGKEPFPLGNGLTRQYLQDGDVVRMSAMAGL